MVMVYQQGVSMTDYLVASGVPPGAAPLSGLISSLMRISVLVDKNTRCIARTRVVLITIMMHCIITMQDSCCNNYYCQTRGLFNKDSQITIIIINTKLAPVMGGSLGKVLIIIPVPACGISQEAQSYWVPLKK